MRNSSFTCEQCGFELFVPIVELACSVLGLYDDSRYPGRCLLVYKDHWEDFSALPVDAALGFVRDVQAAARGIREATQADRINYAILGNAEPHLHAHIIPRRRAGDPVPNRSPWSHPDPAKALQPDERDRIVQAIAEQLRREQ